MAEYYTMQEEMQKRGSQQGETISEQEIDLDLNQAGMTSSEDDTKADQ